MNPLGNAENISFSVICTTQDVTDVSEGGMISSSVETVSLDENVSSRSLVSRQSTVSGGEFYFRDAVLTADCFFLLIDQVDQIGEWTDEEVAITVSSLRAVCKVFKGLLTGRQVYSFVIQDGLLIVCLETGYFKYVWGLYLTGLMHRLIVIYWSLF